MRVIPFREDPEKAISPSRRRYAVWNADGTEVVPLPQSSSKRGILKMIRFVFTLIRIVSLGREGTGVIVRCVWRDCNYDTSVHKLANMIVPSISPACQLLVHMYFKPPRSSFPSYYLLVCRSFRGKEVQPASIELASRKGEYDVVLAVSSFQRPHWSLSSPLARDADAAFVCS